MITLKASIAAAILLGAVGTTAAVTYTVTRMSVAVTCPPPSVAITPEAAPAWKHGPELPLDKGKEY